MSLSTVNSERLFSDAQRLLVGGVNSPVRAFKGVGGTPLFIHKAKGARLFDVDGHRYIDYVASFGPMILGHAPRPVIRAIRKAAKAGTSYGAPTVGEVSLAAHLQQAFPSLERMRLVNSGTEATMSAIRAARGFTGRDKILKVEGGYHGHADHLLVKAGSGATTLGAPDSAGVPAEFAAHTLLVPYNDLAAVEGMIDRYSDQIAAMIIEPICGNMGLVLPQGNYLIQLAELLAAKGILLIFDEVITGFRVALGGAQSLYGIRPDLTCLGKIVGGGLPIGVYGGRADIMKRVSPEGPVYQAGTLAGNPIAVAAGLATVQELMNTNPYLALNERTKYLVDRILAAADQRRISLRMSRIASLFSFFFTEASEIANYQQVQQVNKERYAQFFHAMLEEGVYLPPSPFETCFVSTAHGDYEIDKTITAAERALDRLT